MKNIFLLLAALTLNNSASAANNTADWYLCTGKTTSNEWNFGRVYYGCNASAFGSDSVVADDYSPVVFGEAKSRDSERRRYMEELHAVIRDAAAYYIRKRKPGASSAEVENFQLGILTTAAQETYWTHYRLFTDNRYKMMRGDVGHGHGLMQVDDRHHFPAVQQGLGWNLMGNLAYAMDIFYAGWEKAPTLSCVGSSTNWEARIRSAWAQYNGGPSKGCRWTNPNDTWARNDEGFYGHLKNKRWAPYVGDKTKAAALDVPCLIEKRENCGDPGEPSRPELREDTLYKTAAATACVLKSGKLHCLADFRDHICLRSLSSFTNYGGENVADDALLNYPRQNLDRHAVCAAFDPSLIRVGKMAEAQTAINLRATPGGGLVGLMPRGEVAEVLDFEIRNLTKDRYYKVKIGPVTGFVYGGTNLNQSQWITASARTSPLPTTVARPGEQIQVVNGVGINLRNTPDGTLLALVPKNTKLAVQEYVIRGDANYVYYKVTYGKKIGYIYSGMLLPKDSTASWTKRLP